MRNPDKHITPQAIDRWKAIVVGRSGIQFSPHGLRRTYGQVLLDLGVDIQTVSVMLGHSSTQTTERHYCRKDADSARLEAIRAMQGHAPNLNPPKLTVSDGLPGYA